MIGQSPHGVAIDVAISITAEIEGAEPDAKEIIRTVLHDEALRFAAAATDALEDLGLNATITGLDG